MSVGLIPPSNPATASGLQLLGVYSNNGGASIDCLLRNQGSFTGALFQADFDEYHFDIAGVIPTVDGANLNMLLSSNGGSTWIAANYKYALNYITSAGSGGVAETANGAAFYRVGGAVDNVTSASFVIADLDIFNPTSSTRVKGILSRFSYQDSAGVSAIIKSGGGSLSDTTAVNAAQFKYDTASNIAEGTILVYGKAKSASTGNTNVLSGTVVQVVNTLVGSVATGTTVIPFDDTIPQNTEGDQYMSLAITPKSATNKLKIEVVLFATNSGSARWIIGALFQDSTANALAAMAGYNDTATAAVPVMFTYYMDAGTTSSTSFKVRAGSNGAGTTTLNGQSGGRIFGGVMASSITITEIAV